MQFSMSSDRRREILDKAKSDKEAHVYEYALACGFDPDEITFDFEPDNSHPDVGGQVRLATALSELKMIVDKIAALD